YNPLNNSTNEQQGLNNSSNNYHPLNNSSNKQHPFNNTTNNTANNTANNTINNTTNIKDEVDEEIRRIKESIMNIKIDKKNIRTYSYFVEEQMGRVDTVLQRMYKKMVKCEKIQENGGYFNKLVGILRHKIISYTFLSIKSVRNSVEYFENKIFGRSCCVYEEGIIYGRENRGVVYEEGVSFKTDGVSDNVVVDIEERLKGVSIGEDIGSIGGVNTKGEYRGVNTNGNDNKGNYYKGVNTNGNDYKGVNNNTILEDKLKGFNITDTEDNYKGVSSVLPTSSLKGVNTNTSLPTITPFNQLQSTNTQEGVNTNTSLPTITPFNQLQSTNTQEGVNTNTSLPTITPFNQLQSTNTQ
ncbi:hypothetical protein CWI36_3430p0010, partial [Hamiltosporidium magnivora]